MSTIDAGSDRTHIPPEVFIRHSWHSCILLILTNRTTYGTREGQQEERLRSRPTERQQREKIVARLHTLQRSPEFMVLVTRFFGFSITCALVAALSFSGNLDFAAAPMLLIFVPYLLVTTAAALAFKELRAKHILLLLSFADIIAISYVLLAIQAEGSSPISLNSLYLVVLIPAMLLGKGSIALLGITTLLAYLLTTSSNIQDSDIFFTTERVTQVAMFILFTALAAVQSFYLTSVIRKRDEEELRLKDQFVFTTAHDLRAPFALIRLLAEKYEKRQPKTIEQLREDMSAINENVASASQLLEDLLRLAKGEDVPLQVKALDLAPIITQLLRHWDLAMEQSEITAEYQAEGRQIVMADPQKIGYILDNLISNAVKYNHYGGTIKIWHEKTKSTLVTVVEDTGQGIEKENAPKVFTPYFRELKDAATPGTGLGLYSAKKFVEQMGGTIKMQSMIGGTRFIVTLPMKPGAVTETILLK